MKNLKEINSYKIIDERINCHLVEQKEKTKNN